MLTTTYPHIEISPEGAPYLFGTRIKVLEVVLDHLAHHWDGEEIQRQHPHLTLGQIYSALAYYYDHEDEMDQVIEEQLREVATLKTHLGASRLREKLKTRDVRL